jgi:pantoate--beta-alanine ligase
MMRDPTDSVPIIAAPDALRTQVRSWKALGKTCGLVPTMGALHHGHLRLVEMAKAQADRVIVSIFVNAAQFAPHEDLAKYPRTLDADVAALTRQGITDAVFAPTQASIYPPGFATAIRVSGPADGLESDARPHFFQGVATIVAKLFTIAEPDVAIFGEKDFQQLLVIRRMTQDLNLGVKIAACETMREPDGLAMSSRNAYLSADLRKKAPFLKQTLDGIKDSIAAGASLLEAAARAKAALLQQGFEAVDYLEIRDAETLSPVLLPDRPNRILAAVRLGGVRLIDNIAA